MRIPCGSGSGRRRSTGAQYKELEAAGQLQQLEKPRRVAATGGKAEVEFALPKQGVSLVIVRW